MNVIGKSGISYELESTPISSGGEGEIYSIASDNSKVVKIYHNGTVTKDLENKISYMVKNPPKKSVLSQIAWPIDQVYDSHGLFVGFVMPRLNITNILSDIYIYPPKYSVAYREKLILAQNICAVIHEIHNAGYVFGDFNPGNIGINIKTGAVAFLDTDSYHIVLDASKGKAYRCNVCASGYAAPELLKKCYDHINKHPEDAKCAYEKTPLDTFTRSTDNFALAIHIFKLLNNGYTPFNGVKENTTASTASPGVGDMAVFRDSYCFKPGNKPLADAVPKLDCHPKYIGELFTRAFIEGKKKPENRPTASEWYNALIDYEKELVPCSANNSHFYMKNLKKCPWCEADIRFNNKINPNARKTIIANNSTGRSSLQSKQSSVPSAKNPTSATVNVKISTSRAPKCSAIRTGQILTINPIKTKEIIASLLNTVGWIGFLFSIIYFCLPLVENGSIHLNREAVYVVNIRNDILVNLSAVLCLCLGTHLKNSDHRIFAKVLAGIWGCIFSIATATIYYIQNGYNMSSASRTWELFGIIIVLYIASMLAGCKIGERIYYLGKNNKKGKHKTPHKYKPYEIVLLVIMILSCLLCIPILINFSLFYELIKRYDLIPIAIWIVPVVIIIMFRFCTGFGESTGAWLCSSMATSFTVLVLWLGNFEISTAIIGWIFLAIVAFIVSTYFVEEVYTALSVITAVFLFLIFIVGAYVDFQVIRNSVYSIGPGSHWWMVAPPMITMVCAAGTTVKEIIGF